MSIQAALFAYRGYFFSGSNRNLHLVAKARGFDDDQQWCCFNNSSFNVSDQKCSGLRLVDESEYVFHVIDSRGLAYCPMGGSD